MSHHVGNGLLRDADYLGLDGGRKRSHGAFTIEIRGDRRTLHGGPQQLFQRRGELHVLLRLRAELSYKATDLYHRRADELLCDRKVTSLAARINDDVARGELELKGD